MEKKKNQQRTRKYVGSSSYVEARAPSRAPGQDETPTKPSAAEEISEDVNVTPAQSGGGRGGV